MEKVRKIIGLLPNDMTNFKSLLVKEIASFNQAAKTQRIVTFVLEHDKGDHQFPVLAQVSNMGTELWLNTEQLQKLAKPIGVEELKECCYEAFKASKVQAEISKIIDSAFPATTTEARLKANQELTKLFLEI